MRGSFVLVLAVTASMHVLPLREVLAEVVSVPSDGSHAESSALVAGVPYALEASGLWYFSWPALDCMTDAAWTTYPNPPAWIENDTLAVNGEKVLWLGTTDGQNFYPHTFSPTHVYRYSVVGSGQPLDLCTWDSYLPDNLGSLQVRVEATPEPSALALLTVTVVCVLARVWRRKRAA
jgi:hypothetical protein